MGRPGFVPATPGLLDQSANHYSMVAELLRRLKFIVYKLWAFIIVQYSGWASPIHYIAFDVQVGDKNREDLGPECFDSSFR